MKVEITIWGKDGRGAKVIIEGKSTIVDKILETLWESPYLDSEKIE